MTNRVKAYALKAVIIMLGLALGSVPVSASAFRVTPIGVKFDRRSTSALLTLTNDSTEELRFQITAFAWSTDPATGEMKLTPTEDVFFFPTLLTLKPGEGRKVRVGTAAKQGPTEKSYRIFFEELPPLKKTEPEKGGASVRILTKMGIPIFVAPQDKSSKVGQIDNVALDSGKLTFKLQNTGNSHYVAQSVKVVGLDSTGKSLFEKKREGWYVLASTARSYEVELSADECAKAKALRIEVQTDLSSKPEESFLKRDVPVTSNCGR